MAALEAFARRAAAERAVAAGRIGAAVGYAVSAGQIQSWTAGFRQLGRVTVNFHPDRRTALGVTVADGLYDAGWYHSQFTTGVSNGSRSAVPGGERDEWERRLFEGAYHRREQLELARPIYGALDVLTDGHGGSPRFGSSFLVLKSNVRDRSTYCVGDSHAGPRDVGTMAEPASLLAGLFEAAAAGRLLDRQLGLGEWLALLEGKPRLSSVARVLDGYVEAQIHGGVNLAEDVESVVLDPSFRDELAGETLLRAGDRYGFPVTWHRGSEVAAEAIPSDFRAAQTPEIARRVARADGLVDAAAIGRAARLIEFSPPLLAGDPPDSELQQLKYLWHAVLALGHDAEV
jgi:hypothetical protein